MSNDDNFWFRTLFKLKIYETSGESFQKLFQDIMSYRYSSFQAVAPYGSWGDGGNDGWIPAEKHYFQVYGKKASSESEKSKIEKKIKDDFAKLKNKWKEVECYYFVYNDRFEGMPAFIGPILIELQQQHALKKAAFYGNRQLEQTFMELTSDQKASLLGGVPSNLPEFVDSRAVGEILRHLADKVSPMLPLTPQTAPDFDQKIKLNNLRQPVPRYLQFYSYQTHDIDEFLDKRDIGLKQNIAEEMSTMYENSGHRLPDHEEAANSRYVWMVEQLIPPPAREHPHSLKAYREAAQVILAKYFESCDVYEHPNDIITP